MEKDEGDGMEKGKVDRSHYLFDNKALRALILPQMCIRDSLKRDGGDFG